MREEQPDERVDVRAAKATDLESILSLNRFVQDLHAEAHPDRFHRSEASAARDLFLELLESEGESLFVAEIDHTLVGYIQLEAQQRDSGPFARGFGRLYVHQLSVDPQFRRLGVGRALMGRAQDFAMELGLSSIALDTWAFNSDAQAFFETMGFTIYNVRLSKRIGE